MTDSNPKLVYMPQPVPGDTSADHHRSYAGELRNPKEHTGLVCAAQGVAAFQQLSEMEMTPAQVTAMQDAMHECLEHCAKKMGALENPAGVGGTGLWSGYLLTLGLHLVAQMHAHTLKDLTIVERYAFMDSFVRSYAFFGAMAHLQRAGLTPEQARGISGIKELAEPRAMGDLLMAARMAEDIRQEAAKRGVTAADYVRGKKGPPAPPQEFHIEL